MAAVIFLVYGLYRKCGQYTVTFTVMWEAPLMLIVFIILGMVLL